MSTGASSSAPFVKIGLTGSYYAGGLVKHGQVRWKIFQAKTSYQVPGHDDFTFGYGGDDQGELIESGQTILDEQGRAELEFPLDRQVMNGQHGLSVVATVVDFDGRAATDTKVFQVTPEKLVGISRHPDSARADEEQVLKVMVAKPDGKAISKGVVKAEILQKSWAYVPKRNEQGDLYWDEQEVWAKTVGSDLTLDKGTAASASPSPGAAVISWPLPTPTKPVRASLRPPPMKSAAKTMPTNTGRNLISPWPWPRTSPPISRGRRPGSRPGPSARCPATSSPWSRTACSSTR